jgi:hypothetical protein
MRTGRRAGVGDKNSCVIAAPAGIFAFPSSSQKDLRQKKIGKLRHFLIISV